MKITGMPKTVGKANMPTSTAIVMKMSWPLEVLPPCCSAVVIGELLEIFEG